MYATVWWSSVLTGEWHLSIYILYTYTIKELNRCLFDDDGDYTDSIHTNIIVVFNRRRKSTVGRCLWCLYYVSTSKYTEFKCTIITVYFWWKYVDRLSFSSHEKNILTANRNRSAIVTFGRMSMNGPFRGSICWYHSIFHTKFFPLV